jgi:hypothetical protein
MLREAQRELLVVRVEAADIGEDQTPAPPGADGRARNPANAFPSSAVSVTSDPSRGSHRRSAIGGRLSWSKHIGRTSRASGSVVVRVHIVPR